jgi:hypothetical protein
MNPAPPVIMMFLTSGRGSYFVLPIKTGASFHTPKSSKNFVAPESSVANVLTPDRGVGKVGSALHLLWAPLVPLAAMFAVNECMFYELQEELTFKKLISRFQERAEYVDASGKICQ